MHKSSMYFQVISNTFKLARPEITKMCLILTFLMNERSDQRGP